VSGFYNFIRILANDCTLQAWTYQKLPPAIRTCRHLKELFGFNVSHSSLYFSLPGSPELPPSPPQYEQLRTTNKTPPQVQSRDSTPTPSTNANGKRKRGDRGLSVSSDSESDADADTANKTPRKKTKRDAAQSSSANSPPPSNITVSVLLAQTWKEDKGCDPTGYWISEKLDGVRCVDVELGVKGFELIEFSVHISTKALSIAVSGTSSSRRTTFPRNGVSVTHFNPRDFGLLIMYP
jgi:hypothetical protein